MAVSKKKTTKAKTTNLTKRPAARTVRAPSIRADEKYIVSEITNFDGVTDYEAAIKQNLRHCNYFYTRQDANDWIGKWLQKYGTATNVREFRAAETWRSCISIGTLCRMLMNGALLPGDRIRWVEDKIENEILKYGRANIAMSKKATQQPSNRVSPAVLVKRKGEDFIADLEAVVDSNVWQEDGYSLYNELKSKEIPASSAKAIAEYYTPLMNELQEAIARKPDPQLKEAYSHFKPADLKRYASFIESLVSDAQTYVTGKKAQRKPRKKKEKAASALVAKVKYQKESKELKITSLHPEKIIGAGAILLFNTKYNTLSYLVSSSKTGFTITGTTIQNLDNEKSFKKTLRKASENIHGFVNAPKAKTIKMINDLKTTRSETTGRLSDDVLILKVL